MYSEAMDNIIKTKRVDILSINFEYNSLIIFLFGYHYIEYRYLKGIIVVEA